MKTTLLSALILPLVLAACDADPSDSAPSVAAVTGTDAGADGGYCTLDPETISQAAHVLSAVPTDKTDAGCVAYAKQLTDFGAVTVAEGTISGYPISITGLKSTASQDPAIACFYDVSGFADVQVDSACSVHVVLRTTVEVR